MLLACAALAGAAGPLRAEDSGGGFPRDSVNGRAAARLAQYEIDALPRPPAGRAIRAHRRNA